jgi:hypothetical protein
MVCSGPREGAAGTWVSADIRPSQDLTEFSFGVTVLSPVPGSREDAEATADPRL